jgi:hypothetical protein
MLPNKSYEKLCCLVRAIKMADRSDSPLVLLISRGRLCVIHVSGFTLLSADS